MKTIIFSLAVVLGNGIAASCMAQSAQAEYAIKEDAPRTGSHITRNAINIQTIALNKRYQELSAEDKAKLHSWWESMPAGDEPPFPDHGLKPIHAAILKGQAKLLAQGELYLIATIDGNGDVSQVKAIGSPSPEMTKFAASVVGLTKFKPAVCAGKPCQMDFPFLYKFEITH